MELRRSTASYLDLAAADDGEFVAPPGFAVLVIAAAEGFVTTPGLLDMLDAATAAPVAVIPLTALASARARASSEVLAVSDTLYCRRRSGSLSVIYACMIGRFFAAISAATPGSLALAPNPSTRRIALSTAR
ncbi:MAG: hypothetical protein ACRCWJ_02100 [Casimicrobium sp.]